MLPDVVEIAQALIRCRSVTPDEGGALAFVADLLSAAGFEVERPVFSEPGQPDVANLVATFGAGRPCLALAGHTDVVPPGDTSLWRHDPFGGTVADGMIFGRGAADMKGGVAAMLSAALGFAAAHGAGLGGTVAILLTGDEEGPAVNGTVKLLGWAAERGLALDHCVLGEPTSRERLGDVVKVGRRGSLTGRLRVEGRQGHVAYPHLADNPIPVLARIVLGLCEPLDGGTDRFAPSHLEVTTIDVGNPATNVIPARAQAVFNIRFNDRWTADSLAAEIRARIDRAAEGHAHDLVFDPTNAPAFLTEPGAFTDLLKGAILAETGLVPELSTGGGTSDARFIKDFCPVVEFGLVGRTMHGIDEHVATDDLVRLARIYRRVLDAYFASAPA